MTVDEMLRNLRSVKMRPSERARVNAMRVRFEGGADIVMKDREWLADACKRYRRQLDELEAARERARRTNGLRALGMTQAEARARAAAREAQQQAAHDDLGF